MNDTPLAQKIKRLIEADGPLTVAQYMAICLGDPQHGYYATHDPFGAGGDFITAPEVSQMFGEIVGAWLVHAWRLAGSPSPIRLVELGPGRGTLMADIFRVAKSVPEFCKAASVYLVEQSPVLRARQEATLRAARVDAEWLTDFGETPNGPLLLVANEFFDALPVRQFMRVDGAWHERVVGLDTSGGLAFGMGPSRPVDPRPQEGAALTSPLRGGRSLQGEAAANFGRGVSFDNPLPPPETGDASHAGFDLPSRGRLRGRGTEIEVLEMRPAAETIVGEIAARIARHGGSALILDYGYERPVAGGGDTLQAMRGHAFADPLSAPGEVDLTAHVDFTALSTATRNAGARPHGPISQREFLLSLGLRERAAKLAGNADAGARKTLDAAVARLTGAEEMGELFKVLAITQPRMDVPPFPAAI